MEQYTVTGMSCAACSARVEKAVKAVPGVTSCSVSLLTNSMGVEGTASASAIVKAVQEAGYGASPKAAAAETSSAEAKLAACSELLEKQRKQLPDILVRSSSDALDSIQKTREYLVLIQKHGENVAERVVEELRQIGEKAELLRQTREWFEERNSDVVRKIIMDMRRYLALLANTAPTCFRISRRTWG